MEDHTLRIDSLRNSLAAAYKIEEADELASRLASRGGARSNAGDLAPALEDLDESVALFDRIVHGEGQGGAAFKLALAQVNRGITRCNSGNVQEGIVDFDAAIAIYAQLIADGQGEHEEMLDMAQQNRQIALHHLAQSQGGGMPGGGGPQPGGPRYDPNAVRPMREELTRVGLRELLTPGDVDAALSKPEGTALLVINSVCGCAAGGARPSVAIALQNKKIPDDLCTVFAGMEGEAVDRARSLMPDLPPSSPFIALFKGGQVVASIQRQEIEGRAPVDIATTLAGYFDAHCERQGPSIPREQFDQLEEIKQACGSSVPPFMG